MQARTGTGIHAEHIKYTALQTSNPAVQVMHGKYRYKALAMTQINLHVLELHTGLNLKLRITVYRLPTTIQNCTHNLTESIDWSFTQKMRTGRATGIMKGVQ